MTTHDVQLMRAAFIRETGPADSISVGDVPVPRPGPGSVLVQNQAMAVNHIDTFIRAGVTGAPLPGRAGEPFIVGRDLAGTVAEVGAGVTAFAVGDAVWSNSMGIDGRQGSFSDYSVVPADRLYALPAGVTPETVMTLAHSFATAYLGLVHEAKLRTGSTVFIGGAAGGVGSAAVQLARSAGARVLASCAPHDAEWVRSCGADEVFDRTDPALLDRVYASAPGGVDVWWDTTGRLDTSAAVRLVGRGGRVLVTAGRQGPAISVDPSSLYTRDIQLRGFSLRNTSVELLAEAATALNALLSRGAVRGRIAKVLTLEEAAGAHRLMESHAAPGKLLVKPGAVRPKPHVPAAARPAASAAPAASSAPKPGAAPKPAPAPAPKPAPKPSAAPAPKPASAPKPAAPKPAAPKPVAPKPAAKPGSGAAV